MEGSETLVIRGGLDADNRRLLLPFVFDIPVIHYGGGLHNVKGLIFSIVGTEGNGEKSD